MKDFDPWDWVLPIIVIMLVGSCIFQPRMGEISPSKETMVDVGEILGAETADD